MKTEVTRRMWADLKSAQPTLPDDPTYPQFGFGYPVMNVTWYEAMLFANLLSLENGLPPCYYRDAGCTVPVDSKNYESDDIYCDFNSNGYRLLTEGEWEYADRAGTDGPFFCSEGNYSTSTCTDCAKGLLPMLEQHMVFCADSSGPEPAEGKLANPWGLHNMNGNVREWCWDWCEDYPEGGPDYAGPECGTHRVERGSMFVYLPRNLRSSMRAGFEPGTVGQYLGFRLARTVY